MPRPCLPITPIEWASSTYSRALWRFLTSTNLGRSGIVAVHAVHAFDGDQHAAIFVAQLASSRSRPRQSLCGKARRRAPRQNRALHDAVVRQLVVQDQIAGAEQVADGRFVRGVAADEDDRVFDAEESAMVLFQFHVDGLLARDQPAGRHAGAVSVDGPLAAARLRRRPTCPGSCSCEKLMSFLPPMIVRSFGTPSCTVK